MNQTDYTEPSLWCDPSSWASAKRVETCPYQHAQENKSYFQSSSVAISDF